MDVSAIGKVLAGNAEKAISLKSKSTLSQKKITKRIISI